MCMRMVSELMNGFLDCHASRILSCPGFWSLLAQASYAWSLAIEKLQRRCTVERVGAYETNAAIVVMATQKSARCILTTFLFGVVPRRSTAVRGQLSLSQLDGRSEAGGGGLDPPRDGRQDGGSECCHALRGAGGSG